MRLETELADDICMTTPRDALACLWDYPRGSRNWGDGKGIFEKSKAPVAVNRGASFTDPRANGKRGSPGAIELLHVDGSRRWLKPQY
jgi:hypothetical protein